VLGERGNQQLHSVGIAFLERGVEDRASFGGELGVCLRGERRAALAEKRGAAEGPAVLAGAQTREQARLGRDRHRAGFGGFRTLRRGVVAAGLRNGGASPGTGEGEAADNGAAYRAAEPADEAGTNPLAGLGRTAGGVERDWH